MVILSDEIIYNKIEQGLSYIPGDLVITKHARLGIPKMIISSGEFIISHESWGPMKRWEKEVTAGKTGLLKLEGQWAIQEMGLGSTEKFCQTKMETRSCKYGFNFQGKEMVFMLYLWLELI